MKLTLFLIPLILLSSCTIDWNDEKDKKIIELEQKVQTLEENTVKTGLFIRELQGQYRDATFSGNLLEIRNAECQAELKQIKKQ